MSVEFETRGAVAIITIDRPDRRNAVDGPTAEKLAELGIRVRSFLARAKTQRVRPGGFKSQLARVALAGVGP